MTELDRSLRAIAERGVERGSDVVFERASHGPVTRDRSGRALVLAGGAAVVVVALLAALALRDVDDPAPITVDTPPVDAPVFAVETGVTLVFDDGGDGVTRLDLDTGATQHVDVRNRAGDQPYRLHRTASRLVVGWSEVWSVPRSGEPSRLGDATVFVPDVEEGSVWLVDYEGGAYGGTPATARRVSVVDGRLLDGPIDVPDGALPLRGVPGGIAYETDDGIVVLDASGTPYDATLGRILGDARDELVAFCDSTTACTEGHVYDFGTGADVTFTSTDPAFAIDIKGSRFSPDGSTLAVQSGPQILIVDTATGQRTVAVEDALGDAGHLGWSDDGTQLFWSSDSYGAGETRVGRYDVVAGTSQRRDLDIGGLLSFVVEPGEPATEPDVASFARGETEPPALASEVRLLLGRQVVATRAREDLATAAGWTLDVDLWAGYAGPFSAIEHLARVPAADLDVGPGPRPHCAGPALDPPSDFAYDEHVVLWPPEQPSCLSWFAVEVFSLDGEVVAVGLDRFEP